MPAQTEYSAPAWGASLYTDLTVPSGGKILAKRLDFQDVIAAGLMEEFDTLSPVVEEKVIAPAKGTKKPADRAPKKLTKAQEAAKAATDQKALLNDRDTMSALARLMGLVLPVVVVKPKVTSNFARAADGSWERLDPESRVDGVIYADTIPLVDQMFILQWSMEGMDMSDLESFREQPDEVVGGLEAVAEPAHTPE